MARRPPGLNEADCFKWFMPTNPPDEGCWDWLGRIRASDGYGVFSLNRVPAYAHIASHKIFNVHDLLTESKPFVLHSCHRRICVQPKHLHAGTQAENMREMVEANRSLRGEGHHNAKLTEADIIEIRQSILTQRQLAKIFGVSDGTIGFVRRKERWTHL
jgi:hypothetical protein